MVFRSEGDVRRWCDARKRSISGLLPISTSWALARAWYHDRLSPDWRRPARDEITVLFTSLGLTGPAWSFG